MSRPDRRILIADAALQLAAEGGNHAVTHQGVDRMLELPKGSTSYYFRTREALIDATVARIVDRSRAAFVDVLGDGDPAEVIAGYVDDLVTNRRSDLRARYALLTEPTLSDAAAGALAQCIFSPEGARRLMESLGVPAPEIEAHRLIAVLEGMCFGYTFGLDRHSGQRPRGSVVGEVGASLIAAFPALRG